MEPLLATNLVFALALSRRQARQGWAGLVLLAGGVTAFIVAGQPEGGDMASAPFRQWLIIGVMVGLALLLTAYAKRSRLGAGPVLLAVAAGLLYGVQDVLTRVSGQLFAEDGWGGLFTVWQPYGVLLLGVTGLLLVQSAFETAPLRMSLPALTAARPLAGIVCGVGFLGDRLRTDAGALAWEASGLVGTVVGVVLLGMHPAMPCGAVSRPARDGELQPR